jgi:hypothetical protein
MAQAANGTQQWTCAMPQHKCKDSHAISTVFSVSWQTESETHIKLLWLPVGQPLGCQVSRKASANSRAAALARATGGELVHVRGRTQRKCACSRETGGQLRMCGRHPCPARTRAWPPVSRKHVPRAHARAGLWSPAHKAAALDFAAAPYQT